MSGPAGAAPPGRAPHPDAGAPGGRAVLPGWFALLRRQLHLTPEVNVVLAVLVAVTTLFVVAAPRAAAAAYDDALVHRVATALPVQRDLTVSGTPGRFFEPQPFTDALVADVRQAVLDRLGAPAADLLGATGFAAYSQGFDSRTLPDGAQPGGEPARLTLRLQQGWTERVQLVAGRAPTSQLGGVAVDPDLTSPDPGGDLPAVEVALAEPVAATLDAQVGDALLLESPGDGVQLPQFTVVVTGIFRAVDDGDDYWAADPRVLVPARAPTGDGGLRWLATALVAEDGYGALTGAFAGAGAPPSLPPQVSGNLTHAWRFVWDAERLRAADAAVLTAAVGRVQTAGTTMAPFPVRASTGLVGLLDAHALAVGVTRSLDSVAYAGIAALAVLSTTLTMLVGTSQRRERLRLVRARGASLTQVSLLLAAQTLAWVLPGAVVALVAAWVLVPDGGSPAPLLLAAATVLLPLLVVPWAVRAETRTLHGPPARGRLHPAARLAPELAVLALAVLGVLALRRRGLSQAAEGGVDLYAALVPTLVGLAVGLVVLRLYPCPIRWAAGALARRPGLTAFLGTARAARARPASALPLLVLLLAVALSIFAGTVLSTVAVEQSRAAWREVGADLRVDDPALTAEQVETLAGADGVAAVVPAYRDVGAAVGELRPVTALGADPAAFAELLAGTPLAVDLPDLGGGGGRDDPLPAAVSTAVGDDAALGTAGRLIPLDVRGVVPGLRRGAGADEVVVLVPLADLTAVTGGGVEPTSVLVDLDGTLAGAGAGGGAGGGGSAADPDAES
ncbi:FtsX-like permease family protein, partial [Georgenia yuyongxinii]